MAFFRCGGGTKSKLFMHVAGTSTFAVNNDKNTTNLNFGIFTQDKYLNKKFLVTKSIHATTAGVSGGTNLTPGSITVQGATMQADFNGGSTFLAAANTGGASCGVVYQFIIIPQQSYVQISSPTGGKTQVPGVSITVTEI